MNAYRPTLYGTRQAVSAGRYLATMAGFSILEAGGNGIDAGCVAGIALGVLQPDLVNFAAAEHADILASLAARDPRQAKRAMQAYIRSPYRFTLINVG